MQITTLFFDLDGTLYPNNNGLWDAIATRMNLYMAEKLHFPKEQIPAIREKYFHQYGTTLKGLQINHNVDSLEFLAFVHDVPLEEFIAPDPKLKSLLAALPYSKWIFTNSDQGHASRVLKTLGIADYFEGILDVTRLNYLNKPDPKAFESALEFAGSPRPENSIFFEDIPKNLKPAKTIGFRTVLVGSQPPIPEIDFYIPNIHYLQDALDFFTRLEVDDE
jgi:putative hydrolase of the HAD superfamily